MQEVIQSVMVDSANEKIKNLGKQLPAPWMVQLNRMKQEDGNLMLFQHTMSGPFTVCCLLLMLSSPCILIEPIY